MNNKPTRPYRPLRNKHGDGSGETGTTTTDPLPKPMARIINQDKSVADNLEKLNDSIILLTDSMAEMRQENKAALRKQDSKMEQLEKKLLEKHTELSTKLDKKIIKYDWLTSNQRVSETEMKSTRCVK